MKSDEDRVIDYLLSEANRRQLNIKETVEEIDSFLADPERIDSEASELFSRDRTELDYPDKPFPGLAKHPIQLARERVGMSRGDLAKRARQHEPSISETLLVAIENFTEHLCLPHIANALARSLGIRLEEIFHFDSSVAAVGMLGDQQLPTEGPTATSSETSRSNEAVLEVGDFFGEEEATRCVEHWLTDRDFKTWLNKWATSQQTEFRKNMALAVGYSCLLQNHEAAEPYVDRCMELASADPCEQIDANYIFARNRWYLNRNADQTKAYESLERAFALAKESKNNARAAQCRIYMARIGAKYPELLGTLTVGELYREAEGYAVFAARPDIELLSIHAQCVLLRSQKRSDEVREIASRALALPRFGRFQRLSNYVRAAYGIALRAEGTGPAREKAKANYDKAIDSELNDGTSAMCRYLKADILVDEMFSFQSDFVAAKRPDERSRASRLADQRRLEAIELCKEAAERLRDVGDIAALHKANLRLAFLENTSVERAVDKSDADHIEDYAVSFQCLKNLVLNSEYNEGPKKKKLSELQEIVELYFGSIVINEMQRRGERIDVANILSDSGLLCLSIPLANDLVQVLYSRSGDEVHTVGWFAVKDYANSIRPTLESWIAMDEKQFRASSEVNWLSIKSKFQSVVSISHELNQRSIQDIVILSPVANVDWIVPVESLPLRVGLSEKVTTLAKMAERSIIYANSTRLIDIEASLKIESAEIFASNQLVNDKPVIRHVLEAGIDASEMTIGTAEVNADCEAVVIFGHSDSDFHELLKRLSFPKAKVAILMMCSAVESQDSRGPISANVTFQFSTTLAEDSVLIAPRIAIGIEQACEFVKYLLASENRQKAVSSVVRELVKDARYPFEQPWVVLS